MLNHRETTKEVSVGSIKIGGGNPIVIQSMTNTDTRNVPETLAQIIRLADAGCEFVRLAVPDKTAAEAFGEIKKQSPVPLAADIHFDYRLALLALENGADKLRINPGNIGGKEKTAQVVQKARERNIPIRIGVNGGSLEKELLKKYGGITAEGIVESALHHVEILEELQYDNIIISLKASSVPLTIAAYRLMAKKVKYPLHLGITETGTVYGGTVKSAAGIGAVLSNGIGDTIRVSLTGDPVEEVKCAKEILKAMELRRFGVDFVSCPTCGRTEIDLITIANEVEQKCQAITKNIKVAVMGCVVNGPGEARDADIGIAGGKGCGILFKKGELVKKVDEDQLVDALMEEILLLEHA